MLEVVADRISSVDDGLLALRTQIAVANADLEKLRHKGNMINVDELLRVSQAMTMVQQLPAAMGVLAIQKARIEKEAVQNELAIQQICEAYSVETLGDLYDIIDEAQTEVRRLRAKLKEAESESSK
uniref:Phage protein n=1 Tax=Panagrellus redivivus TaxID=6233 RepID=A0A7E4WCH0_PANRE